jgi:outer membrane protein OmpA-like peptidoglycan-associated protein
MRSWKTPGPRLALVLLSAVAAAAAGCSSSPPPELVRARTAYDQASRGPASSLAPADLHTAAQSLNTAERSFDEKGSSQETRDLAYAAERSAQIATVRADATQSLQQRNALLSAYGERQSAQLQQTKSELERTHEQLAAERARRREAERRAADATAALVHVATVRQDAHDVIITLSDGPLFFAGSADLAPTVRTKLDQVAAVLIKENRPPNRVVVRAYGESTGIPAVNVDLSQRRAQTVRDYLVLRGVAVDRITPVGMGASDSPRLEVVVQPADTSTESGPSNESRP